jgi:hypothetical protein
MGAICSVSNDRVGSRSSNDGPKDDSEYNDNGADLSESRIGHSSVASTGGLQILLQQVHLRDSFRKFVSTQWNPSEKNSDFRNYVQTNPRKIALNCIDFWTDAQDFSFMAPSAYQGYRAYHLYEKYIMHGCSHPVRYEISFFLTLSLGH